MNSYTHNAALQEADQAGWMTPPKPEKQIGKQELEPLILDRLQRHPAMAVIQMGISFPSAVTACMHVSNSATTLVIFNGQLRLQER